MSVHIHTMRSYVRVAFALALMFTLLAQVYPPRSEESELAAVTGRVTWGDHPLDGTWVVFEEAAPRGHLAFGEIHADGSFRTQIWGGFGREGTVPGTYRVRFVSAPRETPEARDDGGSLPSQASGILVHVAQGWNHFEFTLPDPGKGRTLAQHL